MRDHRLLARRRGHRSAPQGRARGAGAQALARRGAAGDRAPRPAASSAAAASSTTPTRAGLPARGRARPGAPRAGDGLRGRRGPAPRPRRRRPRCATPSSRRRRDHGARAQRAAAARGGRRAREIDGHRRSRRCCSSPSRCRADALQREGLERPPAPDRHVGARARRRRARPRRDVYHALLANAADFMVDRFDADVVFVPMERSVLDTQHSHAVIAKMLRAQRATRAEGRVHAPGSSSR